MKLPSQECYHVLQDKQGYIWFATEQGLCKYNGKELTVYNEKTGLPEKAVYGLELDESGAIWVISSQNRILKVCNGKLKEVFFSKSFEKLSKGKVVTSIAFSSNNILYIETFGEGTFVINRKTGSCKGIKHKQGSFNYIVNSVNNKLLAFTGHINVSVPIKPPYQERLYLFENGKQKQVISIPNQKIPSRAIFLLTSSIADKKYVAFGQNLIVLNADRTYELHRMAGTILSLYADKYNRLWVGTLTKGIFCFERGNLNNKPINSLNNYSVSGIIQDLEGNIWCSSLEKGLFICRNATVWSHSVSELHQNPKTLKYINHHLFITWQDKIYLLDSLMFKPVRFYNSSPFYITDMIFMNQQYYISSHGFLLQTDQNFAHVQPVKRKEWPYFAVAKQLKTSKGKLFTLTNSIIGEINNNYWQYKQPKSFIPSETCFEPLTDQCFLVGARDGLWIVEWKNGKSNAQRISGINQSVSSLLKDRNGRIFITTKGEGLFELIGRKVVALNDHFSISSNILFEIVQDYKGRYWISSNYGLYCCTDKKNRVITNFFTKLDGLPDNEVRKLAVTPDRIFFSSIFGISSIPLNSDLPLPFTPKIYLSKLEINKVKMNAKSLPERFAYDQNMFKFHFDVLSFKDIHPHLVYQLKGRDKDFVHTNTSQLELENLQPGEYQLIVYAENYKGIRSAKPFVYSFSIVAPFWQTWWFFVIVIGLILLLFVLVLKVFTDRANRKAEEKNRIQTLLAESQITAIQAQMNPHFVFNAINSIQNYILKNQKEEAYNYLAKFSLLIRLILQNSQKKMIPIAKELEILQMYVELEQMRFKQTFIFEVNCDASIDENEAVLPPTLLQPLLENAIWHGLMPLKDRTGKLLLAITLVNNKLEIVIEDNGIGRQGTQKSKNAIDHHSMALKMVEERIQMIGQLYDSMEQATLQIIDLFDLENRPVGTRVVILLPLL